MNRVLSKTILIALICAGSSLAEETWRGLVVASEERCSKYSRKDYPYPPSIEKLIVEQQGGKVYGPYTKTRFASAKETDIEHVVALSEAHDSGLCKASASLRKAFSSDLLNLTLASPKVNRYQKKGKDAGEWLPDHNRCWFANRTVEVKRKYRLTVDHKEMFALKRVLSSCTSVEMVID